PRTPTVSARAETHSTSSRYCSGAQSACTKTAAYSASSARNAARASSTAKRRDSGAGSQLYSRWAGSQRWRCESRTRMDSSCRNLGPRFTSFSGGELRGAGHAPGDLLDDVVAEASVLEGGLDLGAIEQLRHPTPALTRDQRHDPARASGASGAAGAVQV